MSCQLSQYDLIEKQKKTQDKGCLDTAPFYQASKSQVDNRSYMMYSTQNGYHGYYDASNNTNCSGYKPCDLRYVYATPSAIQHCYDQQTNEEDITNCVVASTLPLKR